MVPFTPDAPPTAGLRLAGDAPNGSDVSVTVLTTKLSSLFGVAFHVTYPADLQAQNVAVAPALGAGAVTLSRQSAGDLAFGITQPDPKAGDAALADGTQLASFTLHAPAGLVQGRLELTRIVARTADAGFVDLPAAGATVTIGGVQ
jgi:hypothetical protein